MSSHRLQVFTPLRFTLLARHYLSFFVELRTRWFWVLAMPRMLSARLCSAVNAGGMGVKSRPANDRQAPADFLVVVQNLHARSELVCVGAQVHARYLRTPPQDALQLCGIRGRCGKYSKARPPPTCQISCQLFEAEPDQLLAGAGRSPFEEIISQRQRQGREGGAGCSVMSSEGRQTGGRPDLLPPCPACDPNSDLYAATENISH